MRMDTLQLPTDPLRPSVEINSREQAERNWTKGRDWLRNLGAPDFQRLTTKIINEEWKIMEAGERRAVYCLAMNAILEMVARIHETEEMGEMPTPEDAQELWDCFNTDLTPLVSEAA